MKNIYYFSHDTNASRDEKILAMRVDYGWEGYGLFWAIIESMAEATDYQLRFSNGNPDEIDIAGLALSFHVSRKRLEKFVENCIKKYKLFVFSENKKYFSSQTLKRRLSMRDEKLSKLRVAGQKGAEKRWKTDRDPIGEAMATPMAIKVNKIKINKSKGKRKKEEENITSLNKNVKEEEIKPVKKDYSSGEFNPIWLTEKEYQKLVDRFGKEDTDDKIDEFSTYSKYNRYTNHYQTLLNWLKKDRQQGQEEEGVIEKEEFEPGSYVNFRKVKKGKE